MSLYNLYLKSFAATRTNMFDNHPRIGLVLNETAAITLGICDAQMSGTQGNPSSPYGYHYVQPRQKDDFLRALAVMLCLDEVKDSLVVPMNNKVATDESPL